MQADDAISHLHSYPGCSEETPFGPDTLVYKVGGKMFALVAEKDGEWRVNLKGDPEENEVLRDQHEAVIPGYHMNKRHWNTLKIADLPSPFILSQIQKSHDLVVASLPKTKRPL